MKHIAYFGGTFDPVHSAHLSIARRLTEIFSFDRFCFLPAFHAPHKPDQVPTSALHRYAMLCLATAGDARLFVSSHEIDQREKRYTINTIPELCAQHPDDRIYFIIGADSWADIKTWRQWEDLLLTTDMIVVSRPGVELHTDHVTDEIRERVVDLRGETAFRLPAEPSQTSLYFTDAVRSPVSATQIRADLTDGVLDEPDHLPQEVANYIKKYELYT